MPLLVTPVSSPENRDVDHCDYIVLMSMMMNMMTVMSMMTNMAMSMIIEQG